MQKEIIRTLITVEQPRNQVSKLYFTKVPHHFPHSSVGRRASKPRSSQSIQGHRFPKIEMLDAKIESALKKIIQNSNLKKQSIQAEHKKAQLDDRFLRGRQMAFMIVLIYEFFQVTGAHEAVLYYSDFFSLLCLATICKLYTLDAIKVLLSINQVPSDDTFESLV